jgi:CysZ protein
MANFFVFRGLNGYLFGREYFEVVALRRLDRRAARVVRRRVGQRMLSGMVHLFGGLRHAGLHLLTL